MSDVARSSGRSRRILRLTGGTAVVAVALGAALAAPAHSSDDPISTAQLVASESGGLLAPPDSAPTAPDDPGGTTGPTGPTGPTGASGATGTTGAVDGPSLQTDLPCYLANRSVALSGTGFPAGATYAVTLDGIGAGFGHTDSGGGLTGHLNSGTLPDGVSQAGHAVQVLAVGATATTSFDVTAFGASFSPTTGDPRTLLVRYSIYGFGLGPAAPGSPTGEPAPVTVYLHYIGPDGRQASVAAIGPTHGPCGSLPITRLHHLFAFTPATGTWHLQFDTQRRYSPTAVPRVVRTVVVH